MITFKSGDILGEDAEALVNTVNCVGIMGRGIALQFKKAFPSNFKEYAAACKREEVQPGNMFVFETGRLTNPRFIINFPTKRHWRSNSRMEDIEAGLRALAEEIRQRNLKSIAIPPLGCGLGGLNWPEVRTRIEAMLSEFTDLHAVVFEPLGAAKYQGSPASVKVPSMTPGRASLLTLMHRYLDGLLDPFVTLLEVHKLMYFMQVSGEPLRLQFKKGSYGPYAEKLRHVLHAIEGHWVTGYADGGDDPHKQLTPSPGTLEKARTYLEDTSDTLSRVEKVSDLVDGFESQFGLELLSTVHWVIQEEKAQSLEEVVSRTYTWNAKKKRFTPRQIELAREVLKRKGFIGSECGVAQL